MATPRDIITNALSDLGVTKGGSTPDVNDINSGLGHLNRLQRSLFGDVIGPRLSAFPAGTAARRIENGEQVLAGAAAVVLTLNPTPKAGDRFGIVDSKGALSTNAATINPNGYLITGVTAPFATQSTNLALNTNGLSAQFFFRGERGVWETERNWTMDEEIYFDVIVERPLTAMLSRVLASTFSEGLTLSETLVQEAAEGKLLFARHYGRLGRVESPPRQKRDPGA